jgi:hypothetical protein
MKDITLTSGCFIRTPRRIKIGKNIVIVHKYLSGVWTGEKTVNILTAVGDSDLKM